ncbi:MAG: AMP-binding protein [Acidobacteriota bacterium]
MSSPPAGRPDHTARAIRSRDHRDRLQLEFVRTARKYWSAFAAADTTGQKLTYGRMLIGALALGRVLARRTPGENAVGTLLPASVWSAVTNIALYMAGRMPVNLNFTIGADALTAAIEQAGIKTILTSRKFLEKAGLEERPGMVFLEELRLELTSADKAAAIVLARLTPMPLIRRWFSGPASTTSPLATIIFSSGSTGVPKGVMLTHNNILSNVDSLAQLFHMGPSDVFLGVLPLFHSFGFTGTFWFPLLMGAGVAYHPNPMDAKTVGELVETYKATMLISTPTFCNAYLRRCTKEQFASLKYAIVGAEKLRRQVADEFREKYGIDLLEGYGMTEMAPVVAVNHPDFTDERGRHIGNRPGSVGHPIPGISAKVVDQETGEDLGIDCAGLLLVQGPSMMVGYLDQPQRTAEAMRNGWYATGDIARIDAEGFIFITDRLSRFSKIGGEMVPHVRVEDAINAILGDSVSIVTGVPDAAKGERLVAFYARPEIAPEQLWDALCASDLPRLWLPRRDNLVPLEAIPTLGTGKADLRRIKQMAIEHSGPEVA